ncbi:MAG: hypothetical protein ED557_04765 [Balneola sp.]|nr:MAG: hypothetical protein ED557_04765 [Balneola sp.]
MKKILTLSFLLCLSGALHAQQASFQSSSSDFVVPANELEKVNNTFSFGSENLSLSDVVKSIELKEIDIENQERPQRRRAGVLLIAAAVVVIIVLLV